ncbi:MAG: serine O-acetyltransferase [Clostridia bacterium]|nr:serine O-acetyltransferase [Clostridia bacterium]
MNTEQLIRELKQALSQYSSVLKRAEMNVDRAKKTAKRAYENVRYDIRSIRERDPAARSDAEVALLYSGFHALAMYRVAHALHKKKAYFPARAISQAARFLTGIEIHPAAEIGRGLFIDHGSAVVIGETAVIGDDCTIYQGVTLGGTGKHVGKRHPTLGNRVMVGAGAKVLGPFKVGDGAKIAAGAVVLSEIPDDSTAVGVPAHVVDKNNMRAHTEQMDQIHIPDPVAQELCRLEVKIRALEKKLEEAETRPSIGE